MTLIISFSILILSLVACMIFDIDLVYGLLAGMFVFMAAALRSGYDLKQVLKMMWAGIRESFIVVGVLLLIGAMTGIWRGSGTIQQMVIYGTELIHPKFFVLFSFLLPVAVSYLIGTSFGTSATIGVVLMTLCAMSGGNRVLIAGAVMSGIYFGDRAAPASSCANLNAYLTKTEIYRNVRLMLKDTIPAALITAGLYTLLSFRNPLQTIDMRVLDDMKAQVRLSPLLLLPALIILFAPLIKMEIKKAVGLSILCAAVIAYAIQGMSAAEILRTTLLGYEAKGELASILSGGGLRSMVRCCIMIIIAATYSGIFNETQMLSGMEKMLEKLSDRIPLILITWLTGIPLIMVACSQTLALMLQVPLIRPLYAKKGISNEQMMLDTADTTVLFSALVPWCLAVTMPLTMLKASVSCLPFAFYLYLPALVSLFRELFRKKVVQSGVTNK